MEGAGDAITNVAIMKRLKRSLETWCFRTVLYSATDFLTVGPDVAESSGDAILLPISCVSVKGKHKVF